MTARLEHKEEIPGTILERYDEEEMKASIREINKTKFKARGHHASRIRFTTPGPQHNRFQGLQGFGLHSSANKSGVTVGSLWCPVAAQLRSMQ
eukprot:1160483-Pelagomonas_calceolata.AAC.8